MNKAPFSYWPCFTEEEAQAVTGVLLSNKVNYWTGDICKQFEQKFAAWIGAEYAITLMNGTAALEAALHALQIGPGDEVIVSPRSFVASASCIVNVGATPIFADVDAASQNITANTINEVLTEHTKAVICVHLAGWPCDMDPIMRLAAAKGLKVIEDCAQAHGAKYKGRMVGSIGDVAAWSFCQDKIMTTGGEGGMLTTQNQEIWSRAWSYKDHGKNWQAVQEPAPRPGFRWLHESFGTNARMLEMQAAIGLIQLQRMPLWKKKRTENARRIQQACAGLPALRVPEVPANIEHAFYKYYVFIKPERLLPAWDREQVIDAIIELGVPCYQGACPEIYREKAFECAGLQPGKPLSVAESLGETSLMFLVHPNLTESEIDKTCVAITQVLQSATAKAG